MAQQDGQNGAEKVAATVTFTALKPQLLVEAPKASDAVQFYKAAFDAEEGARVMNSKRKAEQEQPLVLSAEVKIGGVTVLVADDADDSTEKAKNPSAGVALCVETQDVDAAIAKAVSAGAVAEGDVVEGDGACCGGRVGKVKDPYGFVWLICSSGNKCDGGDDAAA